MKGLDLASDLYAGRHVELLAATVDSRDGFGGGDSLPYVVGALVFKGRLFEAEAWAERYLASLAADGQAFTLFFLAIGYTRHSRYPEARRAIGGLWRRMRRAGGELSRFFFYQVLGFYRYFCGRYANVAHYAAKAAEISTLARFQYGKYLALDLLGHAQVHAGEIGSGLTHLGDALALARQFGDGGSVTALEATVAVYEARFGLAGRTGLERAAGAPTGLDDDTHSRALLGLERIRQLLLAGRYAEAERRLLETWMVVKRNRHRRLDLWTQIVYAELCYRRGELAQALGYVESAQAGVDQQVDLSLRIAGLDLECKIRTSLGGPGEARALQAVLVELTRRQGSLLARRRLLRSSSVPAQATPAPEDRIGRLIDLAHDAGAPAADKVRVLRQAGLLGLLPRALGLPLGQDCVVLDAALGSLVCSGRDGVDVAPVGLTSHVEALLRALAAGVNSREELVARIWGYAYHRLRHDGLLYQLVARTRRLLGPFGDRLVTVPAGYELRCLLVDLLRPPPPAAVAGGASLAAAGLPLRLRRILALAKGKEQVDAQLCRAQLGVSRASLSRDLKVLTDQGLLRRYGVGKATRYTCTYAKEEEGGHVES